MATLTHFSLFTGIGGIDLAAEWAGFETVGQCEFADYPTKVLEKHWPDVPRWRDVRDVTTESVRERIGGGEITIISGGFPCQPHSVAGKHKGADDERDLWPEFRRIVGEIAPKWVLGENVPGLFASDDGRFFGGILYDLASLGYSVGWATYGAYCVGAKHKRERVFIVAYINSKRVERCAAKQILQKFNLSERQISEPFQNAERRFDTYKSRLLRSLHGIPNGVGAVKALGNSVVPQQIYPILQAIADIEMGLIECTT